MGRDTIEKNANEVGWRVEWDKKEEKSIFKSWKSMF